LHEETPGGSCQHKELAPSLKDVKSQPTQNTRPGRQGSAYTKIEISLNERSSGQIVNHSISVTKLIGVPDHVCAAASLPLPESAG